jgi:hypothetical protein
MRIFSSPTLGLLVAGLLWLISGCPESGSNANTSGPQTAATPGAQPTSQQSEAEPEAPNPNPTEPAGDDDSTQSPEGVKLPESKYEEFEEETRPKKEEKPKGQRYTVDCHLVDAKFNNAADAELALLSWEVKGDMPGSEFVMARMEADSPRDEARGKLDLGWCRVDAVAMIPEPTVTATRGREIADYSYFGEYGIQFFDKAGELLVMAKMTRDNELEVHFGDPDSPAPYYVVGHYDRSSQDVDGYDVYRKTKGGARQHLFHIRYRSSGFDTHTVTDLMTNQFIYKYPAGRIEIELLEEP